MKKNCPQCNKEFNSYESKKSKYCSRECYVESIKGRQMPWLNSWRNSPRPQWVKDKISDGHGKGSETSAWKGGKRKDSKGYVEIYVSPGVYKKEHRLVMEKKLRRKLKDNEDVHHKNGNKSDNRLQNLSIISHKNHFHKVCCPKCNFKFVIR